jgi:hypothetical protein
LADRPTPSLDQLGADDFSPLVGDAFALDAGEHGRLQLELVEVKPGPWPAGPTASRAPFSLTFRGPAEPVFAQQMLRLQHAGLGELAIFVVPLGRDDDGTTYEAVFS